MVKQAEAAVQFKHLFTPLRIGSFSVRNRILSTAHATGYAQDGLPSQRHLDYWASKARGGIGLIVTEVQPVHPSAGTGLNSIHAYDDACIEPFRKAVEAVHRHGAKIVAQLWHPGRASSWRSFVVRRSLISISLIKLPTLPPPRRRSCRKPSRTPTRRTTGS